MHSFMAVIWNDQSPEARDRAACVKQAVLETLGAPGRAVLRTGMAVFNLSAEPAQSRLLPVRDGPGEPAGALIGSLFANSSGHGVSRRISEIDAGSSRRLLESGGTACLADYWGNYVCLVRTLRGAAVLTSPSSAIPCFALEQDGLTFVFSHLETCAGIDLTRLTLNAGFVSALLVYDKIQNGETGFNEVRELLGGQRLTIEPGGWTCDTVWDPRRIASAPSAATVNEASEALGAVTRQVVRSWAACFDRVAVNLSGGLDSSIVLSCLAGDARTPPVTALHHALVSQDPKEIGYARMAAEHMGCPLVEIPVRPDMCLPDIESHPLSARPYRQFLDPDLGALFSGRVEDIADVFLTGQGGDHLFHVRRTSAGFADYLQTCGLGPGAAGQLLEAARLSGLSVWQVLRQTVLARRRGPNAMIRAIAKRRATSLSKAPLPEDLSHLVPDWARAPAGLPPGKFDQAGYLVHLFQEREVLDRPVCRRFLHPLVSQPLIELCLHTPVYVLCAGGISRGLARRAFAGDIPDTIRLRMTKGESTRYFIDQMNANRDRIIGALTTGELSRMGFVERREIETFFRRGAPEIVRYGHSLLVMYAIEAWLRQVSRKISASPLAERPAQTGRRQSGPTYP